jgi:hypothetical protein
LELLEILAVRQEQPSAPVRNIPSEHCGSSVAEMQTDRFMDRDKEYARTTHPALFKVIDLLEQHEHARGLSVRKLAQQTGVSKSWCAIAKRYILREKSVH